jgi:DNA-binding LytR/AlgR family response regulator
LESVFNHLSPKRKERFLVKSGQHFKSIPTASINCFFIEERCNFLNCGEGKSYGVDYSLEKIGEMVDSDHFYRVNRGFIVNFSAITDVIAYSPGSLRIKIKGISDDISVMVSRERISSFKGWMDR